MSKLLHSVQNSGPIGVRQIYRDPDNWNSLSIQCTNLSRQYTSQLQNTDRILLPMEQASPPCISAAHASQRPKVQVQFLSLPSVPRHPEQTRNRQFLIQRPITSLVLFFFFSEFWSNECRMSQWQNAPRVVFCPRHWMVDNLFAISRSFSGGLVLNSDTCPPKQSISEIRRRWPTRTERHLYIEAIMYRD